MLDSTVAFAEPPKIVAADPDPSSVMVEKAGCACRRKAKRRSKRLEFVRLALDDAAFELAHGTLRPYGVRLVDSAISALAGIA